MTVRYKVEPLLTELAIINVVRWVLQFTRKSKTSEFERENNYYCLFVCSRSQTVKQHLYLGVFKCLREWACIEEMPITSAIGWLIPWSWQTWRYMWTAIWPSRPSPPDLVFLLVPRMKKNLIGKCFGNEEVVKNSFAKVTEPYRSWRVSEVLKTVGTSLQTYHI